jgi:hypothetical protein
MDGVFDVTFEELDKQINKMDKDFATCINLIKQSVEAFEKVELLYKDCYNKIHNG